MAAIRFYDLLGVTDDTSAAAIWPRSRIKSVTGFSGDDNPTELVHYLQSTLEFHAVRPGAAGDHVGLSAEVVINNPPVPLIRKLVLTQMPDIAFHLQNTPGIPGIQGYNPARLYVTSASTGVELVIEGLPVEIRISSSMLSTLRTEEAEENHPEGGPDETLTDAFIAGEHDSLQVTLRDAGESSIFTHIRVRMTEEMDFIIEPATLISIGPCRFNGFPCQGLHDINFIPSPRLQGDHSKGEQALEWTRHALDRLAPDARYAGVITARTLDLDESREPLSNIAEKMNKKRDEADRVNFVLEDVALPFWNLVNLPIPSHALFGIRREIETGMDASKAYDFQSSPVMIDLGDWSLLIEELLLQTPASLDPLDQFIFAQMTLLFDSNPETARAATIDITDEWTIRLGWIWPSAKNIFEIANASVNIAGAKVGWSLKRFLSKKPHYKWYEQFQLLLGVNIKTDSSSLSKGPINLVSLSGKSIDFSFPEVGWNLGELSLGGAELPEGVQLVLTERLRLIIEELGYITENNGGRYFSFSGGVSDFYGIRGGIRFYRLRFRTSGNPNAPAWLMDGLTLSIKLDKFTITGFGMVSEFTDTGHTYKELGFGINVDFKALEKKFSIGMQLFYGRVSGPIDNFTYWLFGFQLSPIPIGSFKLVDIRLLAAGNMMPNLPAPDGFAENMRLFRWYKNSGNAAITLPASRKLAAWIKKDDSFAFGMGCGVSPSTSDNIRLDLFVFYHKSPEESGLLVAAEVYLLKGAKPVGYAALEFDFERDKWGFMIGVAISLDNVLDNQLPAFLSNLGSLTGTLYAGNKPGTFAIGQLNDQSTWLSLRFGDTFFIEASLIVALCMQMVDMPEGPRGFGFVASVKAGGDLGVGKLQVYATLGVLAGVWRNESKSSGFIVWIEAGIRIKVHHVFNFGVSAQVELDYLGGSPVYRRLGCEIEIETPRFLPDITFRFDKTWSQPQPELLEAISTPIISAGAIDPNTKTQTEIAVTPVIGSAIDARQTYSMSQLRSAGAPAFPAATFGQLTPVGLDSVIAINFKVSVDDKVSVGENTPPGVGTQQSGDVTSSYELVEIGIRRRRRFGPGAGVWTALLAPEDTRLESPSDFPSGGALQAHFTAAVSFQWDKDLLREDRTDPRRLLVNASTPYTFLTENPEADESLARNEPGWPCCPDPGLDSPTCHELDFKNTPLGVRAPSSQTFYDSLSTLHWNGRPPVVAQALTVPGGFHAARINLNARSEGVLATLSFDAPAFRVEIFAFWIAQSIASEFTVEAYKGLEVLSSKTFPLWNPNPPQPIRLESLEGITSVLLRITLNDPLSSRAFFAGSPQTGGPFELVLIRYCGLREQLDSIARAEKCKAREARALGGGGKLAWLPNHEYEITLTTKVVLNHIRSGSQEARVSQQVIFSTKGLPGLNAVASIGDELEPFVESHYPGATPHTLYRAEAVMLAFNEKFNILVPVDRTTLPGKPDELNQLLEWVLEVERIGGATGGERVSQTSPDWIVDHRVVPLDSTLRKSFVIDGVAVGNLTRSAVTLNPFQKRFEAMLRAPSGCNQPAAILHRSQVLFHNPVDPGATSSDRQTWEPNTAYRVNVRPKGGPFVERNPFEDQDVTAFDVSNEGGGVGSPWQITNGAMHVSGSPVDNVRRYAVFGGNGWNHVQIRITVDTQGGEAGIAIGVSGLPGVTHAVMALIDEVTKSLRLVERRNGIITVLVSQSLEAGASGPYLLEVLAFDDRLRARIGETVVETPRDDIREGRLALVAQNGGAFSSLVVEALDAYRFHFHSSRFVKFEDHIGSFSGEVTPIAFDAAGAGVATETVASLLAGPSGNFGAVMTPDADPESRQRLFDHWVRGLALPLHNHTTGLELSRLVRANQTELILLESPEPLPFSKDVGLTLKKAKLSIPVPAGCLSTLFGNLLGGRRREVADTPLQSAGAPEQLVSRLSFSGDQVRGPVSTAPKSGKLGTVRRLVRTVKVGDEMEYRIYDASVSRGRRGPLMLSGEISQIIRLGGNLAQRSLLENLTLMNADEIALLDGSGELVIPITPVTALTFEVSPLRILTNGSETRALIIPISLATNTLMPLGGNIYRFEFQLDRARFRCQTPDEISNYRAEGLIITSW